tara:strand:- start:1000 stop:2058 length:1059 start_codon:yes stop_codon:yes gene_type:complete
MAKSKEINAKLVMKRPSLVEKIIDIPVDDLEFSTDNPRISQHGKNLSQEEIGAILFDQEDARSLKKQILVDGQQYEEPYVRKSGYKYVVEEGNRRTTAMKSILDDIRSGKIIGVSEKDFAKMKCKVLKPTAKKAEIRKFLASIHISGRKDWAPANKGETVYLMIEQDGETFQSVADHLGTSKGAVERLYRAYQATSDYCSRYGGNYINTFSYWDEFTKRKSLQEQDRTDPGFRDYVMELVHTGKITDNKKIRKLAEFYEPGVEASLKKRALDTLNKNGGNILKAHEVFVNYSEKGSLLLIEKARKLMEDITVSALQKTSAQSEIPNAIEQLIKSAKDVRKTLEGFSTKGAVA